MKRMILTTILALGLLMGCSAIKIKDPMKAFNEANRSYRHAISWSEYVVAATFLKNKDQRQVASQIERLNQFRVTAYEPRHMTVVEEDARVRQVIKISYFKKNDMIVKSIADEQLWEYEPEGHTWLLLTGLPDLR